MKLPWSVLGQAMAISLAMTLVLELCYALLWGFRRRQEFLILLLGNILTNPVVVFVYYYVRIRRLPVHTGWVTIGLEAGAVITEALLYRSCARSVQRPWLFSLSANAFSYAVGELINGLRI